MRNGELIATFSAGLIQGIALVAFPAASTILTNPEGYGLSSTEYGSLFIPPITAVDWICSPQPSARAKARFQKRSSTSALSPISFPWLS